MPITGRELVEKVRPLVDEIDIHQLKEVMDLDPSALVIDIRECAERSAGYIVNSINIPRGVLEMKIDGHEEIVSRFATLDELVEQPVYLVCRSGARSALAAESLQQMGFKSVYSVLGGSMAWQAEGFDYHVAS